MEDFGGFKVPSLVPQDLQLIKGILGDDFHASTKPFSVVSEPAKSSHRQDENIDSSDNDTDSEQEVEADILVDVSDEGEGNEQKSMPRSSHEPTPDDVSSSDISSDYESDEDVSARGGGLNDNMMLDDAGDLEDEDGGPTTTSTVQPRTKNEVVDTDIVVPTIEQVGPEEQLEKVGEVMSILGLNNEGGSGIVVVKGIPATLENRAAERALDAETLLVFEDRNVLGYVYETFGPTHQPMYQVKFNSAFPLNTERTKIAREVFHVPSRSNFVFVKQLKTLRGSDASNAHDEEPGEDELEFSDDEQERAHKRAVGGKRDEARSGTSRLSTPTPSQMRDQDMANEDPYGSSSYIHQTYNDMDFSAGPSRPPPTPYDDPYSDQYGLDTPLASASSPVVATITGLEPGRRSQTPDNRIQRGRGNRPERGGRGRGKDGGRGRGDWKRGGERGRGRGRGRGGEGGHGGQHWSRHNSSRGSPNYPSGGGRDRGVGEEYDPRQPRGLSPTSFTNTHVTGQYGDNISSYDGSYQPQGSGGTGGEWGYAPAQQAFDFPFGFSQGYVQPHINPRFASAFGINMGYAQAMQQQYEYGGGDYGASSAGDQGISGEWVGGEWDGHGVTGSSQDSGGAGS